MPIGKGHRRVCWQLRTPTAVGLLEEIESGEQVGPAARGLERECVEEVAGEPAQCSVSLGCKNQSVLLSEIRQGIDVRTGCHQAMPADRKSTRLNSSH